MARIGLISIALLLFSNAAYSHPETTPDLSVNYATGFAVGESLGTGLFIRKYFDRNYVQLVGSYRHGDPPVSEIAFAIGRYFYRENITGIELPVGLHYFFSVNAEYWHDDIPSRLMNVDETQAFLNPSIGLAIDLLNPATKGVGASFSIGYGSRIEMIEDFAVENHYLGAVFASASMVYNW